MLLGALSLAVISATYLSVMSVPLDVLAAYFTMAFDAAEASSKETINPESADMPESSLLLVKANVNIMYDLSSVSFMSIGAESSLEETMSGVSTRFVPPAISVK